MRIWNSKNGPAQDRTETAREHRVMSTGVRQRCGLRPAMAVRHTLYLTRCPLAGRGGSHHGQHCGVKLAPEITNISLILHATSLIPHATSLILHATSLILHATSLIPHATSLLHCPGLPLHIFRGWAPLQYPQCTMSSHACPLAVANCLNASPQHCCPCDAVLTGVRQGIESSRVQLRRGGE